MQYARRMLSGCSLPNDSKWLACIHAYQLASSTIVCVLMGEILWMNFLCQCRYWQCDTGIIWNTSNLKCILRVICNGNFLSARKRDAAMWCTWVGMLLSIQNEGIAGLEWMSCEMIGMQIYSDSVQLVSAVWLACKLMRHIQCNVGKFETRCKPHKTTSRLTDWRTEGLILL